jgi:hypothetical protein
MVLISPVPVYNESGWLHAISPGPAQQESSMGGNPAMLHTLSVVSLGFNPHLLPPSIDLDFLSRILSPDIA